jgi:hypothetical protein
MKFKTNLGVLLLSVFLALVGGLAVSGLLTTSKTLSSTGSVKAINVEVYWDDQCTQVVESVDWGTPEPGDSLIKTIYVKNTGNSQMILNMSCSEWDPAGVDSYLDLSWNRDGAIIDVDEVVQAILTFSVSESISGVTDFSFNIIIEGTG